MRKLLAAIALLAGLVPAAAQVPNFPQTLPANSVVGRLGIGPGPSQAIPFAVLTGDLLNSLTPGAANALLWVDNNNVQHWSNIITGQNYLAAMTNAGEAFGYSFRNSTVTGNTIYGSIFPGVSTSDGIQGVLSIPATATVTQSAAIAAYLDNGVATSGGNRNGVLLFGAGRCTVDGSACWGINTLLQDASARIVGTGSGRILVSELDYNVMNPGTQVIGFSVGGNSLAQSSNAVAFIANSLGAGGPYKWQTGFYCIDGAVSNICLAAGPIDASGTSTKSTKIIQQYFNGAAVKKTVTIQSDTNRIAFTTDDAGMNLTVGTTGLNSGSLSLAGGITGVVSILPQSNAGVYNFNLPVVPGTAGQPLLSGGGGVTPMTFGTLGVPGGGTGIASGTSGGIPYFSSTTTIASSAALAVNGIVLGGGAGAAPSTGGGCSITPSSSSLACASSTSFSPGFVLQNNTNDASFVGHGLYKSRAGAIVQNGDGIGSYAFYGYDGAVMQTAAQIFAVVDGAPGAGSMPGRIVFNTTPSGSVTLAEVFRIDNSQHVQFAAPSIAANGAVATTMTSLGPTGSHTTIQEWLVVKNASGVIRWIPMY
jgi:hypothetical protein